MFLNLVKEIQWFSIQKRLAKIKLFVFDVDGVLTEGGIYINPYGELIRRFNVKDGLGIRLLIENNLKVAFVSGGEGSSIKFRAKQLGVDIVYVEVKNKNKIISDIQNNLKIKPVQTLFVGDDLNDLTVKSKVGLLISTSDASIFLKRKSDAILISKGGKGAVRELVERYLRLSKFGWRSLSNPWTKNN